jgi:hypothetical protein
MRLSSRATAQEASATLPVLQTVAGTFSTAISLPVDLVCLDEACASAMMIASAMTGSAKKRGDIRNRGDMLSISMLPERLSIPLKPP